MHSLILLHKKNIDHCYHDDELLYNVLFGLNHRVSAYKSVLINNISGNPTNNSFRSSSTQQHNNIIRVSDIQGSIYRISSQACAGESSRSGTANVLRNALIWKSQSLTPPIHCSVETWTAQDSGEMCQHKYSQSC